jgi:hypothetical protein
MKVAKNGRKAKVIALLSCHFLLLFQKWTKNKADTFTFLPTKSECMVNPFNF